MASINKQFLLKILLRKGLLLVFILTLQQLQAQISVDITNRPIKEILRRIENTSDFRFFYNENLQGLNKISSLKCENFSIEKTLSLLFSDLDIDYEFKSRKFIVLFERKKNIVTTRQISATVVDENQVPIIGANIMISDTKTGTITDVNGKFTLLVDPGSFLIISHIGYERITIKVSELNNSPIKLIGDNNYLTDIVVVGYGKQKKCI
jgi:hypothetical protein